jgi:hypothetical protein
VGYKVEVAGNNALVVDSFGLQVIDISTPSQPELIGSVDTPCGQETGQYPRGVAVAGDIALVAASGSGLQVIDISTPSQPKIIGSLDTAGIYAYEVAVSGNIALVADGLNGLQVIDISIPSQPQIIASADTPGYAWDVAVSGNTALVADSDCGLQVIDISTPSQPQIIGSADIRNLALNVAVSGNIALVGFEVIDISTPSQPEIIASVDITGDVAMADNIALVTYEHGGDLYAIDISTPSQPKIMGFVHIIDDFPKGAAVSGNIALVTGDFNFYLVDIEKLSDINSQIVGSTDIPGVAYGSSVSGNIAYVPCNTGLQVIDMSNPSQPQTIGSVETPHSAYEVAIVGNTAYVTDHSSLQVIDVSMPSQPAIIGSVDTPGEASGVAVSGNTAFVADSYSGLQVIDVSVPSQPQIVGSVDTPGGNAHRVAIVGDTAFVVDDDLQVIDVSIPSQPEIIASLVTPGFDLGIAVAGNIAFVAEPSGLHTIDISNPSQPKIIGSVEMSWSFNAGEVAVLGDTAFLMGSDSLAMIDIRTPSQLQLIGSLDTRYITYKLIIVGDTVYVAGENVVPLTDLITEITPVTVNSKTQITATLPSPPAAGNWTLRLFNNNEYDELPGAVTFSEPEDYETERQKKAVLVAGRKSSDDWLWQFTEKAANYAYLTLLWQGYTRENVLYLSPNLNTDIDGDGNLNDTDQKASNSNLEQALTSWAKGASELIVFMTSHGGKGTFWMNEEEILRAEELDQWLDTLQGTISGKVIFIYDACMSGSFVPLLKPPAGKERILIASSAAGEPAIFGKNGVLSFSYQFWASAYLEGNLWRAFDAAKEMMRGMQIAHLDANADGIAYVAMGKTWDTDTEDKYLIKDISVGRGHAAASSPPVIGTVSGEQTLNGSTSASFSVSDIIGVNPVIKIWAQIVPPGNISPDTPLTDLPETELTDPDGDGTYDGTYDGFDMNGTYTVSIYAEDAEGFYSPPALTSVIQTGIAETKGDLDGDERITLKDAVAALKLLGGETVSFPVTLSGADVNNDEHIGLAELIYILRRVAK